MASESIGRESAACNVCNLPHNTEHCPLINCGVTVPDTTLLATKAILTLPETMTYKKLDNSYEIISKSGFSMGTQFGPFDAPKSASHNPNSAYVLKLFNGSDYFYLDTSDENRCNWMCLVPFNPDPLIRNCICYQLRDGIYFTVVNEILPGESLILSYSPGYTSQLEASANRDREEFEMLENTFVPSTSSTYCTYSEELDHIITDAQSGSVRKKAVAQHLEQNEEESSTLLHTCDEDVKESQGATDIVKKSSKECRPARFNPRFGAVLAVDKWICKFCHAEEETVPLFAAHLTQHYRAVGAARTEKSRLNRVVDNINGDTENVEIKEEPAEEEIAIRSNEIKLPTFPYICDICVNQKYFNRAEYLVRHLQKHTGSIYCCDCDETFERKEDLSAHKCADVAANDSRNIKCTLCDKTFSSHQQAKQHMKQKHGTILRCEQCHRTFNKASALKGHACKGKRTGATEMDLAVLHKCELCEETFVREKEIEKHINTAHGGSLACNFCKKELPNHSYRIHRSICEIVFSYLQDVNVLTCPTCKSSFVDLDAFRYHMGNHTHPFMCPRCNLRLRLNTDMKNHKCVPFQCHSNDCSNKNFDFFADYKKHIVECHGQIQNYCFECAFPFVTDEAYILHTDCLERRAKLKKSEGVTHKSSSKEGEFTCEKCGAAYTNRSSLKTHRYTHGPKKFVCEICGKGFHRQEMLHDHKAVHEDAQFECEKCGRKVKSKRSLQVHLRIHKDIKKYECKECGKSFAQKINLSTHQHVHMKEKGFEGFQCPYCIKRFNSKEYLSFHIEAHEKGKNQICDICGKAFVKQHMLKQHKRVSHSNTRFVCEYCGLEVQLSYSLLRHVRSWHPHMKHEWSRPGYTQERRLTVTEPNGPRVRKRKPRDALISTSQSRRKQVFQGSEEDGFRPENDEGSDNVPLQYENDEGSDNVSVPVQYENDEGSNNVPLHYENGEGGSDNVPLQYENIEIDENVAQFCETDQVVFGESRMVYLKMTEGGEILLTLTHKGINEEDGEAMVEVEAEVIDDGSHLPIQE